MNALRLHSLCIPKEWGERIFCFFGGKGDLLAKRGGVVKKFCMMWGDIKKVCPFKKYPLLLPAVAL